MSNRPREKAFSEPLWWFSQASDTARNSASSARAAPGGATSKLAPSRSARFTAVRRFCLPLPSVVKWAASITAASPTLRMASPRVARSASSPSLTE